MRNWICWMPSLGNNLKKNVISKDIITFPELSVECLVDLVDSRQETFRIALFSASDSEFAFQMNNFQKYFVLRNFSNYLRSSQKYVYLCRYASAFVLPQM